MKDGKKLPSTSPRRRTGRRPWRRAPAPATIFDLRCPMWFAVAYFLSPQPTLWISQSAGYPRLAFKIILIDVYRGHFPHKTFLNRGPQPPPAALKDIPLAKVLTGISCFVRGWPYSPKI